MDRFFLRIHFFHSFCEYRTFLIHSQNHSIVRQKYSFKRNIHSTKYPIIKFRKVSFKNNLLSHSFFFLNCRIVDPYRWIHWLDFVVKILIHLRIGHFQWFQFKEVMPAVKVRYICESKMQNFD